MVVKNLEFFDKNGYNLNLNWNEQRHIWEGNIFFTRVSVGLYENTTIYVVQYIGEHANSDSDYTDDVYLCVFICESWCYESFADSGIGWRPTCILGNRSNTW